MVDPNSWSCHIYSMATDRVYTMNPLSVVCPKCQAAEGSKCLEPKKDGQRFSEEPHTERVLHYLNGCDKTVNAAVWQRAKFYVDSLHNMGYFAIHYNPVMILETKNLSELMDNEKSEPKPRM
jgi:hypothetical protein